MKTIIFIFTILSLTTAHLFSEGEWQALNSGVTTYLNGVYFINPNTGYVCGTSGKILKTTNGGINWNLFQQNQAFGLNDIRFTEDLTGYCCGSMGIIKTTNAGENWYNVFPTTTVAKLAFAGNLIFAAANTGVFKSTDSGGNWMNINPVSA